MDTHRLVRRVGTLVGCAVIVPPDNCVPDNIKVEIISRPTGVDRVVTLCQPLVVGGTNGN